MGRGGRRKGVMSGPRQSMGEGAGPVGSERERREGKRLGGLAPHRPVRGGGGLWPNG